VGGLRGTGGVRLALLGSEAPLEITPDPLGHEVQEVLVSRGETPIAGPAAAEAERADHFVVHPERAPQVGAESESRTVGMSQPGGIVDPLACHGPFRLESLAAVGVREHEDRAPRHRKLLRRPNRDDFVALLVYPRDHADLEIEAFAPDPQQCVELFVQTQVRLGGELSEDANGLHAVPVE
jgi:hypothetical protein